MKHFELISGAIPYGLTVYALALVSWAVVRWVLPAGTRVGLRLGAVLVGQFVGCAIVVQALGLIGQLKAVPYLVTTLAIGIAVSWVRRTDRLHSSLWRLVRDTTHLWLNKTPYGLGYVGATGLLALAYQSFAYVKGIDSLSIHGPLVVRWIQSGWIDLETRWHYPLCWEYQYAPNFLFLRSDVLVVIPSLLQVVVLLLLVREIASRLHIPGKSASLVSLLCVLNPVVWGGTMKSDPAVGIGLLLSFIALEQVARGRPGAIWLAQLGTFMLLGSKATGFIYAGLVFGPVIAVWLFRRWRAGRQGRDLGWDLARLFAGTLLLQISAASVQVYNFVQHGSPTYPNKLKVAGFVLLDGPRDLSGTSILEAGGDPGTWTLLLRGSTEQLGLDFPVLVLLLLAGTVYGTGRLVYDVSQGRSPDRFWYTFGVLAASACLFWVLYIATPWSRGTVADPTRYIRHGESLRYAIGVICLTYGVATAFLLRFIGRQRLFRFLSLAFLALVLAKWILRLGIPRSGLWHSPVFAGLWKLAALCAVLYVASRLLAMLWRRSRRLPAVARTGARAVVAAGLATLLLASYGRWIEKERFWKWEQPRRQLWHQVRKQVPDGARIGSDTTHPLYVYLLYGARLENRVEHVTFRKVRRGEPVDVDYYYLSVARPAMKKKKALKAMRRHGWRRVVESPDKKGLFLRHRRATKG